MGIRHGEKTILKKISAWESMISKWLADESCVIPVICDAFSQDNFVWCVVGGVAFTFRSSSVLRVRRMRIVESAHSVDLAV